MKVAREGASVAGNARRETEQKTGNSVITGNNAKALKSAERKRLPLLPRLCFNMPIRIFLMKIKTADSPPK
ncbi:MAG: hypothetical protein LBB08_03015 [Rickettsiales bacterium]|jgi:hypothetical protein|nr:hypothetical protein [Rickettsiales bacterium]